MPDRDADEGRIDPKKYFSRITTTEGSPSTSPLFESSPFIKDYGEEAERAYAVFRQGSGSDWPKTRVERARKKFIEIVGMDPDEFSRRGNETTRIE